MPNRQTQNQQQPGNPNPVTFTPDDDEAQQDDVTTAADQGQALERNSDTRSAQQNTPELADEDLDDDADADDADEEEDDEEEDGSGGHV